MKTFAVLRFIGAFFLFLLQMVVLAVGIWMLLVPFRSLAPLPLGILSFIGGAYVVWKVFRWWFSVPVKEPPRW